MHARINLEVREDLTSTLKLSLIDILTIYLCACMHGIKFSVFATMLSSSIHTKPCVHTCLKYKLQVSLHFVLYVEAA